MNQVTYAVPDPAGNGFGDQPRRPRRPTGWSFTAIAGFVLSLIGFLGVTAILGFILGIFGLLATQNDRLRGRALAVAALPISLVMGAFSILILFLVLAYLSINGALDSLRVSLGQPGVDPIVAVASLRDVCSQDFNDTVSDDNLAAWLGAIRTKYGTLSGVQVSPGQTSAASRSDGSIICIGKFVNGTVTIRLVPAFEKPWRCKLGDIEVDGSSPR